MDRSQPTRFGVDRKDGGDHAVFVMHAQSRAAWRRLRWLPRQFMDDGVLADFGFPQAFDYAAERAARAAIDLVSQRVSADGTRVQARVGIVAGLVVVGEIIGIAQQRTLVGETPNRAAGAGRHRFAKDDALRCR